MVHKLVLLRHGESTWNKSNQFTGWTDVSLTEQGIAEAKEGGKLLKENGYEFDVAFSSVLTRANKTCNIVLEELGELYVPVVKLWRLNERHYGALQGLNKTETAEKHGAEQVKIWRRAYAIAPPPLEKDDPRHPIHDKRYELYQLTPDQYPSTESLADTVARVLPAWEKEIAPAIQQNKKVLIAAHGNSLRALIKYLDDMSEDAIVGLDIPTGIPLVYELDDALRPIRHYYLGDAEVAAEKARQVANQAKSSSN
jgi:2,3-bisphosphoglycerate-dependent phosphoglycerate mutase